MKAVLIMQAITLMLLWSCTVFLYVSTDELSIPHLLAGVAMSVGSYGTGFFIYDIIKQWKELSNESRKT